ncbi:hypothetical protein NUW54_g7026 [Trametes sanguinea]|uniref:Uncharacterized protein n=1 Tax=Trametes sanguinea TaxID=158606 RepID=A0ACC1PPR8_9APHY|nr:hypothetical protein NUW54_g7026 [Trametes sanguinea]
MPLFLGPHLKTLAIGFGQDCVWGNPNAYQPDLLCSVLEALPYNCPSLTELEIYPRHHFSVLQAAAELSMACDDIEGYYVKASWCGAMQDDFVDDLSKKRRLRKVWLGLDADTVASVSSLWAANPYPFSSLSILGIDVPRLGVCTAFLKLLRHCRLFSIAVEIHHPPRATELYDFFDTLRLCCSRETLHVFTLDQHDIHQHCEDPDCESDASDSDHRVGLAEIEPVLHFPHLRLFILHVPLFGNFLDEDIVRMADTWPGLINFRLMNARKLASQSPITWKGVGYMVTRCPQLTDIRLTFDTASNNVDEIVRLPGFRPNHWLRFFDVLDSTLSDDAEHFARSLVAIAPRVVLVEASGWTEDPDGPLPVDPYAFCEQLEIIMCRLRKMYMSDIYDLDETGDTFPISSPLRHNPLTLFITAGDEIVKHTSEWSAWP